MVKDKDKIFVATLSFNAYPTTACVLEAIKRIYDRENIVLCVLDNASTDQMKEYHRRNTDSYDMYTENPFNNGTMFAINQMIKEFKDSPCEWMIYHEGDAVPFSIAPGHTLKVLWNRLKYLEKVPMVIGFSMAAWPKYPLVVGDEPLSLREFYMGPVVAGGKPLPDPVDCRYQIPDRDPKELLSQGHEPFEQWNELMEATDRPSKSLVYESTSSSGANPLWMSLAVHRQVWERLGYFDEADQHGDIDFYRRFRHTGWDMGISNSLKFFANDFQYNKATYMDRGRWVQLRMFQQCQKYHNFSVEQTSSGKLFRSSIYDPKSLEQYNPVIHNGQNYEAIARKNLSFMKNSAQPDFSNGLPSWLEKDNPKYEQFKPILIGKLRFCGDDETANKVEKGEI